jgi:hypothetical protein
MNLEKTTARILEVAKGEVSVQARQRMSVEAEQITRAGATKAHIAIIEAAIRNAIAMLYEPDTDGHPANYEPGTGRILIPVPWGSAGWAKWGLRDWEAKCLRAVWKRRLKKQMPMLFDFNGRQWFLRDDLYPTLDDAARWLQSNPIEFGEWFGAVQHAKKKRDKWPSRRATNHATGIATNHATNHANDPAT